MVEDAKIKTKLVTDDLCCVHWFWFLFNYLHVYPPLNDFVHLQYLEEPV